MNMKRLVQIAIAAALVLAAPVQATLKYTCDFETEAARARWKLNPATASIYNTLPNKWHIGAPGQNGRLGQNGLYISDDDGVSTHYTNKGNWVWAYDTLTLDPMTGNYTIFFDYQAGANGIIQKQSEGGGSTTSFEGLYLLWIPMVNPDNQDSVKVMSSNNYNPYIPAYYDKDYIDVIDLEPYVANIECLSGSSTWRQCVAYIPGNICDGTPHYLAFAWSNGTYPAQQPGAVIDNINISDVPPCDAPTNLTVTMDGKSVEVSWKGTTSEYEISAYSYDANGGVGAWFGPYSVEDTTFQFPTLPMGQTDFIVRAKCDDNFYSLKTIESKLIYYPDELCVDYLNLDNAVCYVNNSSATSTVTFNDFKVVSPVDYGPSNMKSRHTLHFDRHEKDPRTGNLANTVPEGEFASVRLGNWDAYNQCERIEFSFPVDTIKHPVLLLKYMPVLEAPGHEDFENPRFKLDILINGQTIGECGQADFNANDVLNNQGKVKPSAAAQGWHVAEVEGFEPMVWKEWTTVGVNLKKKEYAGKTVTARLTTHDCVFSAHCGYAYFTLGCSDGKLQGMKCGEINPEFEAPDGFEYRWMYAHSERYRRADGSVPEQYVLGREQKYVAGMHDDSLYVVDCMFVQDSTCFFSLYATTLATNPIPQMEEPKIAKSCIDEKYTISFDASPSWVQEIDHVKDSVYPSENYHIEYYEWKVENLADSTAKWSNEVAPTFTFPITGGDYRVSLRVTCGTCDSTLVYDLHLDPLGASREYRTDVLCDDVRKGAGYIWNEKPDTAYFAYGTDSIVLLSPSTQCDSIIYLTLTEPLRIFEDTMLLPESLPFTYHGRTYGVDTKTMVDTVPSSTNCDSTWVLNLEIYESLIASMPKTEYVFCEGDNLLTLVYDIARGRSLRYSCTFSSPEIHDTLVNEMQKKGHYEVEIPINDLYPNVYQGILLLADSMPEFSIKIPFTVTMNYSKDVITQRWNDVLAIRNADYNGGYQFDSVQWYLSGLPIEGAIDFNYYAGMDNQLQFGKEYTALLTRNDGVKLFTCPFIPVQEAPEIADMPSLVPISAPMRIRGKGTATWVDMLGRIHHTDAYDNSDIVAPGITGYFLLVLQSNERRAIHRVMVR